MFSISHILTDGLILCLLFGVFIITTLYLNPRTWLRSYPAEIKAIAPPLTPEEKRTRKWLLVPFMLMIAGIPYLSARGLPLPLAYAHVFLILNMANLFDALVIDWLFLAQFQPKFALIPEAQGKEYLLLDRRTHIVNYFKGIVIMGVFSLPVALAAAAYPA